MIDPNLDYGAPAEELSNEKIKTLGELTREVATIEKWIGDLEAKMEKLKSRHRNITTVLMPEIMLPCGINEIKTLDGRQLKLSKFYAASIPDETKPAAFAWLREHNFDSIIKSEISATFGKGEDERVQQLMEKLVDEGFSCKSSIHPMTLKSFVKEQMEIGTEFPPAIKIHVGNIVKIK